jgi:hypothetical protein
MARNSGLKAAPYEDDRLNSPVAEEPMSSISTKTSTTIQRTVISSKENGSTKPRTGRRKNTSAAGGRFWIASISFLFLMAVAISSLLPLVFIHTSGSHHNLTTVEPDSYLISSLSEWKLDENPLLKLVKAAGIAVNDIQDDVDMLPRVYRAMTDQYGDMRTPIVFGMETCSTYQANVPKERRITAVAGMFNTGTNAMEYHLRENLKVVKSVWQVPWGKHRVPFVRLNHVAPGMININQEDVLPVIMIRDPFHWMQSMCKSPYAAHWKKTKLHCPNLVPTTNDLERFGPELQSTNQTFNVTVNFDKNQIIHWTSLIDLYNDWYRQYFVNATYPRLIVRFEDMLLHAPTIVRMIGNCVGVDDSAMTEFKYQVNSAKQHGSHTDFMNALLKSGNIDARIRNMTSDDINFAIQNLDPYLMETMQYLMPYQQLLQSK